MDCAAIDDLPTTSIDMTNYADIITRSLQGEPLNDTPIPVPACLAAAADPAWTPEPDTTEGHQCLYVEFHTDDAVIYSTTEFPSIKPGFAFTLNNQSDMSYALAASYADDHIPGGGGYCPCSNFTGTQCDNAYWNPVMLALNNPFYISYFGPGTEGSDLGYCAANYHQPSGTGGFLFNIYAPIGTIPATGVYKGSLTLEVGGASKNSCGA